MKELEMALLTAKYTQVWVEDEFNFGAPHLFKVERSSEFAWPEDETTAGSNNLATIHFQEGPVLECGVNGVCHEDLIAMVICRLEHFQKGPYACRENALAITALEEALLRLRQRTMGRSNRNVEGTSAV